MASINNIQVKGVKCFMGEEGPALQGNVYYKGKKLGLWSQDGWGGPDWFGFKTDVIEAEINKYYESKYGKNEPKLCCEEIFFEDLVRLSDDEKTYKKGVKLGYPVMVKFTDGYHVGGYHAKSKDGHPNLKKLEEFKKTAYKNKEVSVVVYDGLEKFNVVVE